MDEHIGEPRRRPLSLKRLIIGDNIYGAPRSRSPEDIVRNAILQGYIPHGKVLDIGAGRGDNTIFLAENGFRVHATDRNFSQLAGLRRDAKESAGILANHRISTEQRDATQGIEGTFAAILCTGMLNDLSRDNALRVIRDIKEHTKEGGINLIAAVMNEGDFWRWAAGGDDQQENPETDSAHFFARPDELCDLYAGWEVLDYREEWREYPGSYGDSVSAKNKTALLSARKPKALQGYQE